MPGLNTYQQNYQVPSRGPHRSGIFTWLGYSLVCWQWQWQFNGSAIADPSLSCPQSGRWLLLLYLGLSISRNGSAWFWFGFSVRFCRCCCLCQRNMSMIYCSLCGQVLKQLLPCPGLSSSVLSCSVLPRTNGIS